MMCRILFFLVSVCTIFNCLYANGVYGRSIQKRQTQTHVEATINSEGLLNLASSLHNIAGDILNKVQQSVQNGGQFQFGAQFAMKNQIPPYGSPIQYGQPPFNPPPRQEHFGPPGYGEQSPPPRHHHHHHHGHRGKFRPPGRPDYGPPEFGSPPPRTYPYEGGYQQGHQGPQSPPNNMGEPNEGPGKSFEQGQEMEKDKEVIAGYIDGSFPIILLDEENEIRR